MDDWSEIEYLTEKDLPYFRKKAEKGEAVILEILHHNKIGAK